MYKKITQRMKDNAVNAYFNGSSVAALCSKYRVKKSAIYNWIKESKDELSESTHITREQNILRIVSLVLKGASVQDVCHKYNLKQSTVYYWVNKYQNHILDNRPNVRKKKEESIDRMKLSIQILKQTSMTNDMNLTEKVELIHSLKDIYPIKLLCELFDVGRNTYYSYINKDIPQHIQRDQKLRPLIKEAYIKHRKQVGAEKIKTDLQ